MTNTQEDYPHNPGASSSVLEHEQIISGKTVSKRDGYQLGGSSGVVVEYVNPWSWQLRFRSQLLYLLAAWFQVCNFTFLTLLLICEMTI